MVTNSQSAQVRSAGCVETIKLPTQLAIYITLHYNVNNKVHRVQSSMTCVLFIAHIVCSQPDSVQSARLSAVSLTERSPDHFPRERVGSGHKTTIPQEHPRVC